MKIYRRYITRNGKRIYTPPGQKAICFEVTEEQHKVFLERKSQNQTKNGSDEETI